MANLTYRPIGSDAAPWPEWIRAYGISCGVYVIRDKSSHSILYVGSSKSRLYDTITRHFQQWKRTSKGRKKARYNYEASSYGSHDPGLTYSRSHCEVAVHLTSCGDQLDEEGRLIRKLKPRDNLVTDPGGELEDAPF